MGEVLRFVSKSERERARLIREAPNRIFCILLNVSDGPNFVGEQLIEFGISMPSAFASSR
jgi:hypothetical protein